VLNWLRLVKLREAFQLISTQLSSHRLKLKQKPKLLLNNKLLVEPLPSLQLKLLLLKSMSKLKLRPKLKLKPKLKYKLKLKHKLLQKLKLKLLKLLLLRPLSPRKLLFQTHQISIKLPLLLLPPLNLCQKRKHGLR
jgi:hypothetical protein